MSWAPGDDREPPDCSDCWTQEALCDSCDRFHCPTCPACPNGPSRLLHSDGRDPADCSACQEAQALHAGRETTPEPSRSVLRRLERSGRKATCICALPECGPRVEGSERCASCISTGCTGEAGGEATPEGFVPCGIDQQPQRQDDLRSQMATVLDAARRLGCYDAMDWLYVSYFDKEFDRG